MTNPTANVENNDGDNVNVASLSGLLSLGLTVEQAGEVQHLRTIVTAKAPAGDSFPTLKDKIRAEKQWRIERKAAFARLYAIADQVGREAAENTRPTPMHVVDTMTGHRFAPVRDGVCGFAWVTVRPATSSFARWAKEQHGWSKGYPGGTQLWIHGYNQSMERKEQYARAFARVLTAGGVEAFAGSRMD